MKSIQKTKNLTGQIFEQLKDHIITGKWKPGFKIPSENELTKNLNVSRIKIGHSIIRRLGSAISEAISGQTILIRMVGIHGQFGQSASSHEELLDYYHLTPQSIVESVKVLLH